VTVSADRVAPFGPDVDDLDQHTGRPRWWTEVLVIVWLCWVYDDVANLAPLRRAAAYAHARSILHFEQLTHLDPEAALNRWLAGHHTVALWVSNYYDNAHFIVTLGLVGLLWWRYPSLYRPLRNSLVLINVVGLAVFWWYPTAPPRLLDPARYVDIVATTHAIGSWHTGTLATAANQLAAMPSLHIAWAAWSSLAVGRILGGYRNRWVLAVWLYPAVTTLAVLATGNHFLVDAVAGLATMVVCTVIADRWAGWVAAATSGLRPATRRRLPPASGRLRG
jgi:diacylglycerol O-acyltransferase / wax synthase